MDTVKLDGDGFTPKKNQGDKVKKGDLLLEFDIDIITPMIITNTDDYSDVISTDQASVVPGDEAITVL